MLAKSDGLSLEEHIEGMLCIYDEIKNAFPIFDILFRNKNFWSLLKLSIIYHDLGKATFGFQKMMKNGTEYRFRHEIIGAIIAKNLMLDEIAINAILAHHKSFDYLQNKLKEYCNNEKYHQDRWIGKELVELDIEWIKSLFQKYGQKWDSQCFCVCDISDNIRKWTLRRAKKKISELEKFQNIFLSATLSICDHNASAGIKSIPILKQSDFTFLKNFFRPYSHQNVSWNQSGNVLLVAPTGQGKTESSLGWLEKQLSNRQGRAFYILPFTASINAMVKRVKEAFKDENLIGLLHGKAKFFVEEYYEKSEGQTFNDLVDIHKKIVKPFKVLTPFQILKWAFGVKGFEKGLAELAGSYLIFDEIHIFDKELFRKTLFFIEWLIEKLEVKVFIMSATLPSFIQKMITDTLGIERVIKPDSKLISSINRHKIQLITGKIEKQLSFLQDKLDEGKTVLVICNSVAKSQYIYAQIDGLNKTLLHSGFNQKDRVEKEKTIQSKDKPQLLVGTQAIEVSLDIDYDLIVTEPAPLDALLQRFGRVYRKRTLPTVSEANCFVTTDIEDVHSKIYDEALIKDTLFQLKAIENEILNENRVQEMLDVIYKPYNLNEDNLRENFRAYLDNLYPYNLYEESEDDFFSQFDGIEVLPISLFDVFIQHVENKYFLEAEKLFVSISRKRYMQHKDKISYTEIPGYRHRISVINLMYSNTIGLTNNPSTNFNLV